MTQSAGTILLSNRLTKKGPLLQQLQQGPQSVLMVRRGYLAPRYAGVQMPPMGMVEALDESPAAAAARETFEEIDVRFSPDGAPVFDGCASNGLPMQYYTGDWEPVGDFPQLKLTRGIAENIGIDYVQLDQAIAWGEAADLRYAEALKFILAQSG